MEDLQSGNGPEQSLGRGFGGHGVMAGEDGKRAEILRPTEQLPAQRRLHFRVLVLQPINDEILQSFNVVTYTDTLGQLGNGNSSDQHFYISGHRLSSPPEGTTARLIS